MAVASALAIRRFQAEVIVIDDGSTDGTRELKWEDGRVKMLLQSHAGGNVARNRGMQAATGTYLKFLDDDDYLNPEAVEKQIDFLNATQYHVCFGSWYVRIERGNEVVTRLEQKGPIHDPVISLLGLWSCAPFAYLLRTEKVREIVWDEKLAGFQDFDFFLKVAESVKAFYFFNEIIGHYRVHEKGNVMQKSPLKRALHLVRLLDNACMRYQQAGDSLFTTDVKKALAQGYYASVRVLYQWDRKKFRIIKKKIVTLDPTFRPSINYPKRDQQWVPLIGMTNYEAFLQLRRRLINFFTGYLNEIEKKVKEEL